MGSSTEQKGVLVGLCLPICSLLEQHGLIEVIDERNPLVYRPTRRAEKKITDALELLHVHEEHQKEEHE